MISASQRFIDREIKIYALIDTRTEEVRYVGMTADSLLNRFKRHLRYAKKDNDQTYKARWIRALAKENLTPRVELIEDVPPWENWQDREKFWIAHFKSEGHRITNATDGGGEGIHGYRHTNESKEKIRESSLAALHTFKKGNSGHVKKCETGCKCGKHDLKNSGQFIKGESSWNAGKNNYWVKKCEPNCRCERHKSTKCPVECTCPKHVSRKCLPGCRCGRHCW